MNQDILYKPNLDYQKNYYSEGAIESTNTSADSSSNTDDVTIIDKLEDLNTRINSLQTLSDYVPSDISDAITISLKGIRHALSQISKEDFNNGEQKPNSKTVVTTTTVTDDNKSNTEDKTTPSIIGTPATRVPDSIFSKEVPNRKIEIAKTDKIDKINNEYSTTLYSILNDYVNNLNEGLTAYMSHVSVGVVQTEYNDSLDSTYTSTTTDIPNKDLYHISDSLIRYQIMRTQKLNLYKKLFSEKETITHLKACKVSKDLKVRYYSENFVDNAEYLDVIRNSMLSNAKEAYDSKYKENLFNLYKYLNSSVIVINECLSMAMEEAQAKLILYKEKGK